MPTFSAADLREIATEVFLAAGAPEGAARLVADSLVEADLTGHDSHGFARVAEYVDDILAGRIDPRAESEVVRETVTTLVVDGHKSFGQVVASRTMDRLIVKALEANLAAATIFRCGHIGRVGVYPAKAAERGLIGLAFVNGGGAQPRVAPHGGIRPVFGTNPLAAAVAVEGDAPIVIDFSTSVVVSGKIRLARDQGMDVPEGWIVDREGRATRRPEDYYAGGMLLPAAGHKGYALSLLVELLGGLLTGAGTPAVATGRYAGGNGVFFLAINVEAFRPLRIFTEEVRELCAVIRATPVAIENSKVLIPGEPEQQVRSKRLAEGVPVADVTWKKIVDAARRVGCELSLSSAV